MKKVFCVFICSVIMLLNFSWQGYAVENSEEVLSVSAKACVLIEASTGKILFSKNPDKKLPMASTTKIMTTLLCLESGNLDEQFVVDPEAIKVEGSSMGLVEGDIVTKRALCYGMLLPSGNDAANATAIKIGGSFENFAALMNERAKEIGMTRTCFVTPSGLEAQGHGSSAFDMALLTREALENPDFVEICSQSKAQIESGNPPYKRWLTNTNKLLTMCEGVIGVKTGFTDEAGRCLVSACERNGVRLICVTLNASDDWNDHMKLYDMGFSKVSAKEISYEDKIYIDTVGSEKEKIEVSPKDKITIGSDGNDEGNITVKVIAEPFVYAPVIAGEQTGILEYYYDERLIDSVPLYASESADIYSAKGSGNKSGGLFSKIKGAFGM